MSALLFSLARINGRNLMTRPANLAVAVLGFSGLVFVLSLVLSVRQGLTGLAEREVDPSQIIVLRSGTPSETMSQISRDEALAVERNLREIGVQGFLSSEAVVPVDVHEIESGVAATIIMRGVSRPENRAGQGALKQGKWFEPGTRQMVVGARAARAYSEFGIGKEVTWGREKWHVVGIFDTGGTMADSEVWTDMGAVQTAYSMGSTVQSLYFPYRGELGIADLRKVVNQGAESDLDVQQSSAYFCSQLKFVREYVRVAIIGLASFMIACIFIATASIMDSVLEPRARQYCILHALGFSSASILAIISVEGALIGLCGGAVGLSLAHVLFNAVQVTTATENGQIAFVLQITMMAWLGLLLLSATVGAAGAMFAAYNLRRRSANFNSMTL